MKIGAFTETLFEKNIDEMPQNGIIYTSPNNSFGEMEEGVARMYTQNVTINNEVGLHARPATFFIQKANEFKSGIWVEKDERRVNAKSLLGVLSLGITKGTEITLLADGSDEKEAVNALCELVSGNFGE